MIKGFRTYELAVSYYKECAALKLPSHFKDQLLRASSSIAMNLSEGSAKPTRKDRIKYYAISFGSLRETQTILELADIAERNPALAKKADHLAACLYKLVNQS